MNPKEFRLAAGALGVITLCACASTTPQMDGMFGNAVNRAKMQQTLYPDAGSQPHPVAGIGGTPARESVERYHDTFRAPPPTFEVIFGSGVSGGGR